MAATRTQIYLTAEQRRRLDLACRESGASLAEVIRVAVDEYLDREPGDLRATLAETFGSVPAASAPPRSEWDR